MQSDAPPLTRETKLRSKKEKGETMKSRAMFAGERRGRVPCAALCESLGNAGHPAIWIICLAGEHP
jgi:hypothetical protein